MLNLDELFGIKILENNEISLEGDIFYSKGIFVVYLN